MLACWTRPESRPMTEWLYCNNYNKRPRSTASPLSEPLKYEWLVLEQKAEVPEWSKGLG